MLDLAYQMPETNPKNMVAGNDQERETLAKIKTTATNRTNQNKEVEMDRAHTKERTRQRN